MRCRLLCLLAVSALLVGCDPEPVVEDNGCGTVPTLNVPSKSPGEPWRDFGGKHPWGPLHLTPPSDHLMSEAPFAPTLDGLPAVGMDADGRHKSLWFAENQPTSETTRLQFLRSGALVITRSWRGGEAPGATEVQQSAFPEKTTPVMIGRQQGVVYQEDPQGVTEVPARLPYWVLWSSTTRDFSLVGVRSPERLVALARDLVC